MEEPMVSLSADIFVRSPDTAEYVSLYKDMLFEATHLRELAKNLAKCLEKTAKRRFFRVEDMRFTVTRFNPDTTGRCNFGPLWTHVVLDEEGLRGVTVVLTILVNDCLK